MAQTLADLEIGRTGTITRVGGESQGDAGALRQHFLDMGLIPGEEITLIKFAPMGDPIEYRVQDYELTLRMADAKLIEVTDVHPAVCVLNKQEQNEPELAASQCDSCHLCQTKKSGRRQHFFGNKKKNTQAAADVNKALCSPQKDKERRKETAHPGLGESGKYHDVSAEKEELKNTGKLTFALVGNQNCGKTTLFNQLTGSNQHVGNFPGVTVDRKSGAIKGYPDTEVVDLPGIYSLSPYTSEEIVSREFILKEKPTAIINIVDATNIERNLYLTMQILELGIPMVLALNMMDELTKNGGAIRINEMEELLQIPVIPISAAKNEGIDELIRHAVHIATYGEGPGRDDFCDKKDRNGAVHRAIHGVTELIRDHAERAQIPARFAATKIIEGDALVTKALNLSENEEGMLRHIVTQMEEEGGLDRQAAMAQMRFTFIRRLCAETVVRPRESREHARSARIDRVLTGKWTAIPVFVFIMAAIFYLTFGVIGRFFQNLLADGIEALANLADVAMTAGHVAAPIHSLVIDAIFTGVGTVVSFVPIIVVLFFFLSILEDSGYIARVAFVMDKLLRKIGLSGRSIVPMIIGFGCTVPAVMSTRTLPSDRDRRMTAMLIPFMSCSAKVPVYAFFAAAFFPNQAALIMCVLYFTGILVSVLVALISKNTIFKGGAMPFVMELPNYRLPGPKNVLLLMWDKAKDFLQKAFTVIFIGTIIVWFLQKFDFALNMVSDPGESMLAAVSGLVAEIFKPLGLGDWRIATAVIAGFMAKESIVSMLVILFGGSAALAANFTGLEAFTFLIFCLLYTPCIAAISAIRREQGRKFAFATLLFQCSIAWFIAFLVHGAGMMMGL